MKTWAPIPTEFNDWWNQEYKDSTNPFALDSAAYWAWAGWSAAKLAPPAEEAPQQEPDWSNSETLPTELWKNPMTALALRLEMADGAVAFQRDVIANLRKQLEQQPATHGGPEAWAVYWGLELKRKNSVHFSRETADLAAGEIKSFETGVRPLYLHPQPTPELVQAARQALEALEQSRLTTSNKIIRNLCQQTIAALQNALKGTT